MSNTKLKKELKEKYERIKRVSEAYKLPIHMPVDEILFNQTRFDSRACVPYVALEPLLRIQISYTENLEEYVDYPFDDTTYLFSGLYKVKGKDDASYVEITYTGDMIPTRDGDVPGFCGIRLLTEEELKEEARYWAKIAKRLDNIDENYEGPAKASYFLSEWGFFSLGKELFENIPECMTGAEYEQKNPSEIYPEYVWDTDSCLDIPWPCDEAERKAQTERIKKQIGTLPDEQKKIYGADEIELRLHCDEKAMKIKEIMERLSELSKEIVRINRMLPEMKAEVIANDILFSFRFGESINKAGHCVEGLSDLSGSMITLPGIQKLIDEANELGLYEEVERIIRRDVESAPDDHYKWMVWKIGRGTEEKEYYMEHEEALKKAITAKEDWESVSVYKKEQSEWKKAYNI